jgi:hypothetical protein
VNHCSSADDKLFRSQFEACVSPLPFGHLDHVRLAYVHLAERDVESTHERIQNSLLRYLDHHDIDPTKYHETLTRAWILAVRHFMEVCPTSRSAASFLERMPRILNSKIMLKHYSANVLFSEEARARFVEPDLMPIPSYHD